MAEMFVKEIMPNVFLRCAGENKFKTGFISVTLTAELRKETASMGAILPYVLRRGTVRHPDMESLSEALDELYGAQIEPFVRKKGERQCSGFYADFVEDKYLPGTSRVFEQVAAILGELLTMPATSGGRLNPEYVESEKKNLKDRIGAILNDKIKYSRQRLTEIMCENERYGINVLGSEEQAERITVGKLTRYYRKLVSEARMDIFYCGSCEYNVVEGILLDALESLPRVNGHTPAPDEIRIHPKTQPRYINENMDVIQGKLAVGFRLGETMKYPNYAALRLFNAVYGGSITSKLFVNVRERLSLCYFASSVIDVNKGVMLVVSGIEFDKYQAASDEILNQLDKCRNGDILEEEISDAKSYVIAMLKAVGDSQYQLENYYFSQPETDIVCSPEETAALVEQVTRAELIEIAKCIELDTVYFLMGKGREAECVN